MVTKIRVYLFLDSRLRENDGLKVKCNKRVSMILISLSMDTGIRQYDDVKTNEPPSYLPPEGEGDTRLRGNDGIRFTS